MGTEQNRAEIETRDSDTKAKYFVAAVHQGGPAHLGWHSMSPWLMGRRRGMWAGEGRGNWVKVLLSTTACSNTEITILLNLNVASQIMSLFVPWFRTTPPLLETRQFVFTWDPFWQDAFGNRQHLPAVEEHPGTLRFCPAERCGASSSFCRGFETLLTYFGTVPINFSQFGEKGTNSVIPTVYYARLKVSQEYHLQAYAPLN